MIGRRRPVDLGPHLPHVVELIQVALASGLSVAGAIDLVARFGPEPTRGPFGALAEEHRSGRPLRLVLADAADRLGPSYRSLTMSLARSEREGAPLASLLDQMASEAERARRQHDEAAIGRLSVAVVLPLVLCALPAVFITAVVPLVIVSLSRL